MTLILATRVVGIYTASSYRLKCREPYGCCLIHYSYAALVVGTWGDEEKWPALSTDRQSVLRLLHVNVWGSFLGTTCYHDLSRYCNWQIAV